VILVIIIITNVLLILTVKISQNLPGRLTRGGHLTHEVVTCQP